MQDVQELKQSIFCGVPRVYNRIYTGILIIIGYSIMDILKVLKINYISVLKMKKLYLLRFV